MGNAFGADRNGYLVVDGGKILEDLRSGTTASDGFKRLYPKASPGELKSFNAALWMLTPEDFEIRAARTAMGPVLVIKSLFPQTALDATAIMEAAYQRRNNLTPVLFLEEDLDQEDQLFSMLSNGVVVFRGHRGTKFNIFGKNCSIFTLSPISLDSVVRMPMEDVAFELLVETANRLEIVVSKGFGIENPKYEPSKSLKDIQESLRIFSYLGPLKASDYI